MVSSFMHKLDIQKHFTRGFIKPEFRNERYVKFLIYRYKNYITWKLFLDNKESNCTFFVWFFVCFQKAFHVNRYILYGNFEKIFLYIFIN